MNIKVNYFDNLIEITDSKINVLEIENKKYFYRFVNDLFFIRDKGYSDDVIFFEDDNKEKNMNGKLKVFVDFFDFQFDSKKYVNEIVKYINENIDDDNKKALMNLYNRMLKLYKKILNDIDLPLIIDEEVNVDNITKFVKVGLNTKNDLLDNLILLIDLERVLVTNSILFFINLKQYLSNNELLELYKYSVYNGVKIFMIDSQSYGCTLDYEKKMIIDENLDEFVL